MSDVCKIRSTSEITELIPEFSNGVTKYCNSSPNGEHEWDDGVRTLFYPGVKAICIHCQVQGFYKQGKL